MRSENGQYMVQKWSEIDKQKSKVERKSAEITEEWFQHCQKNCPIIARKLQKWLKNLCLGQNRFDTRSMTTILSNLSSISDRVPKTQMWEFSF